MTEQSNVEAEKGNLAENNRAVFAAVHRRMQTACKQPCAGGAERFQLSSSSRTRNCRVTGRLTSRQARQQKNIALAKGRWLACWCGRAVTVAGQLVQANLVTGRPGIVSTRQKGSVAVESVIEINAIVKTTVLDANRCIT